MQFRPPTRSERFGLRARRANSAAPSHQFPYHDLVEADLHRGLIDGGACSAKQRTRLPVEHAQPDFFQHPSAA